jgi:hypothetical protein
MARKPPADAGPTPEQEAAAIASGARAVREPQKSFQHFIIIGHGCVALQREAERNRTHGRLTFRRLLDANGYKAIRGASLTNLLNIMEHKPAIVAWHAGLPERRQFDWAAPNTVWRRWRASRRGRP